MKSILNVTVNGLTAKECVKKVQDRMDSNQKSAFNIAVLAAYATGVSIPAYHDFGEATIDKKLTRKAFYTMVDRSRSTLSRWLGALDLIINAGDFVLFADGVLPFQYDKVYLIYNHLEELTADFSKEDLFKMSVSSLEALITEDGDGDGDGEKDEDVTFIYDGTTYTVAKKLMESLLKKATAGEKVVND